MVVPVYNEAPVLAELSRRCAAAAAQLSESFEIVLVDDASTDETRALVGQLPPEHRVRLLPLDRNAGQLAATLRGLAEARGRVVVVLDGDLQDPPEVLVELVRALERHGDADVASAVKASRDEPGWFVVAASAYHAWQRWAAESAAPSGAGSYCAMRQPLAHRVAGVELRDGNLAALLAGFGARFVAVSYEKAARYDDHSRVGVVGLVREALGSLALTGALGRTARSAATFAGAGSALALCQGRVGASLRLAALAVACGAAGAAGDRWRQEHLK